MLSILFREMMPGPITPLSNSLFMRSMEYALQVMLRISDAIVT